MAALRLRITGLVQGVFFRAETRKIAASLGLAGWVRNCDDGAVDVHAEGPDAALQQLRAWCAHGPPMARVERVEAQAADVEGFRDFEIRH